MLAQDNRQRLGGAPDNRLQLKESTYNLHSFYFTSLVTCITDIIHYTSSASEYNVRLHD